MTAKEREEILDTALSAGTMLLQCGAETRRAEETVVMIAGHYGLDIRKSSFSLTNGLMVSYYDEESNTNLTEIRSVPIGDTRLDLLIMVNQLSRDIVDGKYTVPEAKKKLEEIGKVRPYHFALRTLGCFIAVALFSMMFGGNWKDMLAAGVSGALTYAVAVLLSGRIPGLIVNMAGGVVMALSSFIAVLLIPGAELSVPIVFIGAVMPLVPGVAFANGVRDIGYGDFLSGMVRLLNAILTFAALAAGAGLVYGFFKLAGVEIPVSLNLTYAPAFPFGVLAAAFATVGFSMLYHVSWRHMPFIGVTGAVCWLVFLVFNAKMGLGPAAFFASVGLAFCSFLFSRVKRCPMTVFLVPGIIPIVPGCTLFFSVFDLLRGNYHDAAVLAAQSIIICGAIVLGTALVSVIPGRFFALFSPKNKAEEKKGR
ncbi:MAG: threonine/serine exporter family protein [Lachnospiraceae bacterium]|nr:threonine/serine exporter family protein [Lachnospiraceae bacterium]MBQ7602320.1 threonine/serine exporter family protein [Lachnospiraceae bacterium]